MQNMQIETPNFWVRVEKSADKIVWFSVKPLGGTDRIELVWYLQDGREIFSPTMWSPSYAFGVDGKGGTIGGTFPKKGRALDASIYAELPLFSNDQVTTEDMRFIYDKIKKRDGRIVP
jgi:hypothetical protein